MLSLVMMRHYLLILVIFFCIFKSAVSANPKYRLPLTVVPSTYSIKIQPNIDESNFKGEVTIFVKATENVEKIVLHNKNLKITAVQLDYINDNISYDLEPKYDLMNIFHKNKDFILSGSHVVFIKFEGKFSEDKETDTGFRKGQYITENKTSNIYVTNFQATFTREMFPCFDEPHFKARFNIRVISPNETFVALSNMKTIAKFRTSEGIVYDFQQTPLMCSYLVTIALTDYPHKTYVWNNRGVKVPISVYSPYATIKENWVALVFATTSLEYFSNYTGIKYRLPKLDMIEFSRVTGATENWGLVTFDDGMLSPSENQYTLPYIFTIIAHEICHFWFGNLVSDYWWNDIWLHEAFAEYLSRKVVDLYLPGYYQVDEMLNDLQSVYRDDFSNRSVSISNQVESVKEIENQFSQITYTKGGDMLRMIEDAIGEVKFRASLREYLNNFAYKVAFTDDMIQSFEKHVTDIKIRDVFVTWLYQRGIPLIYVEEDEDHFVLTQKPFATKRKMVDSNSKKRWTIPIRYYTDVDSEKKLIWFDKDMDNVKIAKHNASWIKLNYKEMGPYKIKYSEKLWNNLVEHLSDLEAFEQLDLLREAYMFFENDMVTCDVVLDVYKQINASLGRLITKDSFAWTNFNILQWQMLKYDNTSLKIFTRFMVGKFKVPFYTGKHTQKYVEKNVRQSLYRTLFSVDEKILEDQENVPEKLKICNKWFEDNIAYVQKFTYDVVENKTEEYSIDNFSELSNSSNSTTSPLNGKNNWSAENNVTVTVKLERDWNSTTLTNSSDFEISYMVSDIFR